MRFRPATLDDVELACGISDALFPDEPCDPVVLRHHWASPSSGQVIERLIGEESGVAVAYAIQHHAEWELVTERNCYCELGHPPGRPGVLEALVEEVERRARDGGAGLLGVDCREDREDLAALLEARGYRMDTLAKAWELDLAAHRDDLLQLAEQTRAGAERQGIRLLPVSADPDPDRMRALYEAWMECRRVMPRTHEMVPIAFELWLGWMEAPDHRDDRHWIAKDGARIVAMSFLRYPPTRGNVWTGFTGTVPSHQCRGIARAVKMETLAQAIELGVPRVRTDNDERNAPMLHINERLGYHRIPGWRDYEKSLIAQAGDSPPDRQPNRS